MGNTYINIRVVAPDSGSEHTKFVTIGQSYQITLYIVMCLSSAVPITRTCPRCKAFDLTCTVFDIDGRQQERHGGVRVGILRSAAGVWRQLTAAPLTELIVEDSRSRGSE